MPAHCCRTTAGGHQDERSRLPRGAQAILIESTSTVHAPHWEHAIDPPFENARHPEPPQGKGEHQQVSSFELPDFRFDIWRKSVVLRGIQFFLLLFEVVRIADGDEVVAPGDRIEPGGIQIGDGDGVSSCG